MIIVGGTFDKIHKGHKALLDKAIQLAYCLDEKLVVTVTEDLISTFKSHPINKYIDRVTAVECYILDQMLPIDYSIYKLHNHPSEKIIHELESAKSVTLVVSQEKYANAFNTMKELGIEMIMVIIPMVKASDGKSFPLKNHIDANQNIIHKSRKRHAIIYCIFSLVILHRWIKIRSFAIRSHKMRYI